MPGYTLGDFQYDLPEDLVAQRPLPDREASRMMVLHRGQSGWSHRSFSDFPSLLAPDTLLVLNNTKVIPARLEGRFSGGGKMEALLVAELAPGRWEAMVRGAKKIKPGKPVVFCGGHITATAVERTAEGHWVLDFDQPETFRERLWRYGFSPLPPYIKRDIHGGRSDGDRDRYQTVFARQEGAVAAPTAGLHFSPQTFQKLDQAGIERVEVTLHVGAGTFQPVREDDLSLHKMHREWYGISEVTGQKLLAARQAGRPVVAVGTTVVRALESWSSLGCPLEAAAGYQGYTQIFIQPPYAFGLVDGLLTNFHLPKSTLLMLVAAFHGKENTLAAYQEAVEKEYRFFSYGDCMYIGPA